MREPLRIAIVGAGIGGLAAAYALRRVGHEVVVYEQAPEFAPIGASIDVGPNAIRLLDALGCSESVRRLGVRPDWIELVRWQDGRTLLRTPHGEAAERYFGAPLLDFLRPDLHEVLAAELPASQLVLDARVVGITGGRLTFADGRTDSDADVVVAADGVRSTVRQLLVGSDEPVFSGTVVYRGLLPRESVCDLHPDLVNRYWLGPRRHAVAYWVGGGRMLAVNAAVQEAKWARESWTDEALTDEVLAAFEGWHEPLLERIRRTKGFLRGAVFVRKPLERWSFGRVVLLGDAAHAMEPFQAQGAAQAIEDAYVLADVLDRATAADAPLLLSRYEQRRMARASEVQTSSASAAGNFYLEDGPAQRKRDAAYETLLEELPWGHRQPLWEHDVRTPVEV
ncbi:MAG: FAD-dependent oxidoreductase [Actinomycetota bacterium]|nr:FAD-dependent oxidoreductase [Actinomycetota bacterium]